MPIFNAPLDDIRFVLNDVLHAEQLSELPGFEEATNDLIEPILEEGAKICQDVLFPINQSGDGD